MSGIEQQEIETETVACAECSGDLGVEERDEEVLAELGVAVCDDCATDCYEQCADCERVRRRDDLEDKGPDNEMHNVCAECATNYSDCEDCGGPALSTVMTAVGHNDTEVCVECATNYSPCRGCDVLQRDVESVRVNGRREDLCPGCVDDLDECGACGDYTRGECCSDDDDDGDFDDGDGAPEPNSLSNNTSGFYRTPRERQQEQRGKRLLYLGFELEVECGRSAIGRGGAWDAMSCDYLRRHEDGSLHNGFEIVSMPMTYEFFKSERESLHRKLRKLQQGGVQSYNTSTCGIHIHLSRNAFSPYHLLKFMRMLYDHPTFTQRISQRQDERLNQWASLTNEDPTPKRLVRKAKGGIAARDNLGAGRYVAVNLENRNTVELRIFRGNLKPERFSKNIEFAVAVFHFTKQAAMSELTVARFAEYVVENSREYPNLHAFLAELSLAKPPRVRKQ